MQIWSTIFVGGTNSFFHFLFILFYFFPFGERGHGPHGLLGYVPGWLQQNGTAVHTAISVSAGLNANLTAVISRLTDRPRPVRSLRL